MVLFVFVSIVGALIYYFLTQAFKLEFYSVEMLTHNLYHFFSGFLLLGGLVYFDIKKKINIFLILSLIVLILDGVYDYMRNVGRLDLLMMVYNSYLLLWGAFCGYSYFRHLNKRIKKNQKLSNE